MGGGKQSHGGGGGGSGSGSGGGSSGLVGQLASGLLGGGKQNHGNNQSGQSGNSGHSTSSGGGLGGLLGGVLGGSSVSKHSQHDPLRGTFLTLISTISPLTAVTDTAITLLRVTHTLAALRPHRTSPADHTHPHQATIRTLPHPLASTAATISINKEDTASTSRAVMAGSIRTTLHLVKIMGLPHQDNPSSRNTGATISMAHHHRISTKAPMEVLQATDSKPATEARSIRSNTNLHKVNMVTMHHTGVLKITISISTTSTEVHHNIPRHLLNNNIATASQVGMGLRSQDGRAYSVLVLGLLPGKLHDDLSS